MVTAGERTVPSPSAPTVPSQYGVPSQRIAARERNGPNSSTSIVTGVPPRPVTLMRSDELAAGLDDRVGDDVVTLGAAFANVVSAASPHGVVTPSWAGLGAIASR